MICVDCGNDRPNSEMWGDCCAICRDLRRDLRKRAAKYHTTPEHLTELYERQGKRCGVCLRVGSMGDLAVDHDWESGRVRGWLCGSCNQGLGRFRHDPMVLLQAARYLLEASDS